MWRKLNQLPILFLLDLAGVAVFAVSGALAAGRFGLDWLGVLIIAAVTAIGGGTLRDLLMNRHPIFWFREPIYLWVILLAALGTIGFSHLLTDLRSPLLVADAMGLALFALSGAQLAEAARLAPPIVVLMGTITGAAGGVMRDILTDQVPLILRGDIYATAAIAGVALYLILQKLGVSRQWAFVCGLVAVMGLRLLAIALGLNLPVFRVAVP